MQRGDGVRDVVGVEPTGEEIGPLHALDEAPVECLARARAGVKQHEVGGAVFDGGEVGFAFHLEHAEDGLARHRAQARDVVVILAAVELRDIDDAVV